MNTFWTKLGLFAGGVLFGTAGIRILSSRDAKRAYTHTTAAVLRAKDCVMETATRVKENADDILADAKEINEARAAKEAEEVADTSFEDEE
ncbi:MAG: DUF6110 family protein [Lachnospiraceae bacterium]|nr:DUF6110 family protein [Lachnospiraceae bacterium]